MSLEYYESLKECIEAGKRFYAQPEDEHGQTMIFDVLNTEPVCIIFTKYHPYAFDIILKALEELEKQEKKMESKLQYYKNHNKP